MTGFSSADYWDERYKSGRNSGAGSYGRLQDYKASFINDFIRMNGVKSVVDFGTGDGSFVSKFQGPAYTGVDVSQTVIDRARKQFSDRPALSFLHTSELKKAKPADLALSLDVIYHLVEDEVFEAYMANLFSHATRFVLVYASNYDRQAPSEHVRHRKFTDFIDATLPEWSQIAHIPNPWPYDKNNKKETSFADFYLFATPSAGTVVLPGPPRPSA